jgi:hypothetical protein
MRVAIGIALAVGLGLALAALAAGATLTGIPAGHGSATGPGIPYENSANCTLAGRGYWCSDGFQANTTEFNTTDCFSDNSNVPTAVWAILLNQSEYEGFQVNNTLTH